MCRVVVAEAVVVEAGGVDVLGLPTEGLGEVVIGSGCQRLEFAVVVGAIAAVGVFGPGYGAGGIDCTVEIAKVVQEDASAGVCDGCASAWIDLID